MIVAKPAEDHRINFGRLFPSEMYKGDCSCGWSYQGHREQLRAAMHQHKSDYACSPIE